MEKEIYEKIISKKEFSKLLKKDVELAWSHFEKRQVSEKEKVRLTRDSLRRVFSVFASQKLLVPRDKRSVDWVLKKHLSTRERFENYSELYDRLLKGEKGRINVIDLGAGVNGFSYKYFPTKVYYYAVEAVGQLVDSMNSYFCREKLEARAEHISLFDLENIKSLVKSCRGKRIVFLFKVIDSLEMLERDYSKKLLKEIVPLADKVVVSFAMRSLLARKKFKVKRTWIKQFIEENFKVLDSFELGNEEYIVFGNRN